MRDETVKSKTQLITILNLVSMDFGVKNPIMPIVIRTGECFAGSVIKFNREFYFLVEFNLSEKVQAYEFPVVLYIPSIKKGLLYSPYKNLQLDKDSKNIKIAYKAVPLT